LERQAEKVRAGLITPAEARKAEHVGRPIAEHVDAYITSLEASGASPKHVAEARRVLKPVLGGCGFGTLGALERSAVERRLIQRRQAGASARTRNIDLVRLLAFANWCKETGRLIGNPFEAIGKANEAETRRKRRAMTDAELGRLLDVARRRPLLEALTVRTGKRKGQAVANVRPEIREQLEATGRERALMYKVLVLTGLRRGELASLCISQVRLDGPIPHVELDAEDEKNREGNGVVVRSDLAEDLRRWLADRLAVHRAEAAGRGEPILASLPADRPLFYVPSNLLKIFDRDLKAAGIPKKDERGRTLDIHALRTTFGTMLSRGGVPLRMARAAMRHSDPSLTANVYTDPRLLDVSGALDTLPALTLDSSPDSERVRAGLTGTYDDGSVAPLVALTGGKSSQTPAITDKMDTIPLESADSDGLVASTAMATQKARKSFLTSEPERAGEEIRTPDVQLGKPKKSQARSPFQVV